MADEARKEIEPTKDECALYDDIAHLAKSLWDKSKGMEGLNTDPKMFSNSLFKRLWTNHQGYTLLWKEHYRLESDILLRSALETAICISALVIMRDDFVVLMKRDAAHTLTGQIKIYRDNDATDMVRDSEAVLRLLLKGLPEGVKPAKLDWKELAEIGSVQSLYEWHRRLSGVSSHVTGLSIMDGFGGEGLDEKQRDLRQLQRKMHLMQMAAAALQGSQHHATMLDATEEYERSRELTDRMNAVSWDWPGVKCPEPESVIDYDVAPPMATRSGGVAEEK